MNRKEFLGKLGLGAAFVLTVPCLHACGGDDDEQPVVMPPTGLNVVVDLEAADSSELMTPGGFIILRDERIVVARTLDGEYAAASWVCSHEANLAVVYDETEGEWFCGVHGARFAEGNGAPINDVTNNNLTIFSTSLNADETLLTITS